jgi:hypothetical protein
MSAVTADQVVPGDVISFGLADVRVTEAYPTATGRRAISLADGDRIVLENSEEVVLANR